MESELHLLSETMKRLYILFLIAASLCSCSHQSVTLAFDYERLTPMMFSFTNLSSGYQSYRWDFGDGTFAYGTNAKKTYAQTGEYIVTLTAETSSGVRHDYRRIVQVTEPYAYISGYTFYEIPYENRYYRLVFKDDALLPSSWDCKTSYTPLLTGADLPYTVRFNSPKPIEPSKHDYYTVQVMRTTDTANGTDTQCMKQKLTAKELLQYLPEYVLSTETGSTIIGIRMTYEY